AQTKQSIVLVTHNLLQAQKLYDDLTQFIASEELYLYPANELIAAELSVASPELRAQRIETLNYLSSGKKGVFIVPMAGLRKIIPSQDEWKNYQIHLQVGTELALETEILKLVQMGYSRVDMVNTPGDFSVRGGIIDLYPLTEENPVRIE